MDKIKDEIKATELKIEHTEKAINELCQNTKKDLDRLLIYLDSFEANCVLTDAQRLKEATRDLQNLINQKRLLESLTIED